MTRFRTRLRPLAPMLRLETFEERITPSIGTSIAKALDLPAGTSVGYSGSGQAVNFQVRNQTGAFLGFPTGADSDFMILSTGSAAAALGPNTDGDQGSDLGADDEAGDTATIHFRLKVPPSDFPQKLKFDFLFASEEYPEFVGSSFNDTFSILANGVEVARDEVGNPADINSVLFSGGTALGTIFDGRTSLLSAVYNVPGSTTTVNVAISIGDVGDGIYDSAVLLDNVRFEAPQIVVLDFDGATVGDHFAPGTTVEIPAFKASDVKAPAGTESTLIQSIIDGVKAKYANYDLHVTTTPPTTGKYMTLVIGGHNDLDTDVSGATPIYRSQFTNNTPSLRLVAAINGTRFGQAADVDLGNRTRDDRGVIFSGEFGPAYSPEPWQTILNRLIGTTSHELGHNLGLRHVTNAHPEDLMKQHSPRNPDATFGTVLLPLAESWSDEQNKQNDDAYLKSILGAVGAAALQQPLVNMNDFFQMTTANPIYDFSLIYNVTGTQDSDEDEDLPTRRFYLPKFDGTQLIPLPVVPVGTTFAFSGSSKKNGPTDLYSGTPVNGQLTYAESFVDLFDSNGNLTSSVPIAQGELGSLVSVGSLVLVENTIPTKKQTFTDLDGDQYTVRLKGPGLITAVQDDANSDGRGGLQSLQLHGTDPAKSTLSVTVKKFKGAPSNGYQPAQAAGDGMVNIGVITGMESSGLKLINAPHANLTGTGLNFNGFVGRVRLRDVTNGADLVLGASLATPPQKTTLLFRQVHNGSSVTSGAVLRSLTAVTFGDGNINAPSIGKLVIKGDAKATIAGDFAAAVTTGPLGTVVVKGQVFGSQISATGIGSFVANRIVNSTIFAGFTPTNANDPLAGGTFLLDARIGAVRTLAQDDAFVDSYIATGTLVNAVLSSINADNGGVRFGFLAQEYVGAMRILNFPTFDYDAAGAMDQSILPDFHVLRA